MSCSRPISRRLFLGGAAAAISLPFLDAMRIRPAHAGGDDIARMLFYFLPNGIHPPSWTPDAAGAEFDFKPIAAPLEAFREDLLFVSGLSNRNAEDVIAGDHARGTASFLTARSIVKSEGEEISNGVSVDQEAAPLLGEAALFPSLQLGIDGGDAVGACDSGYSCAYIRNISWASETTPLAKVTSPRLLFDRMFAGYDPTLTEADRERRRELRTSVLDHALAGAESLNPKLGSRDRAKLDEYMTGVRELELRIAATDSALACAPPDRPPEDLLYVQHVQAMTDLMVLAFECDLTRTISFMFGNGSSYRAFPFLGVSGAHHELSHHQNDPEKIAAIETIATWEIAQAADLIGKLKDRGLLESSMVYIGSEISDGNGHWHYDLPVAIAGQLGGRIETGRHARYDQERPIADLYLEMLQSVGSDLTEFGGDGADPLGAFQA
ncbi:MAG: DUF1552 domain-containing protein [Proteobacteria bacterium]|nr:DUF1552 domain-containing protein [Pseudomonadota bacterium]